MSILIRPATPSDEDALVALRKALWPGGAEDHRAEVRTYLTGASRSTLPFACFVAEAGGRVVGFVEVDLRSHVDGCDPKRPAGYLEGWYVEEAYRGQGAGRALVDAAEAWCADLGCSEMGSDTWVDNEVSERAHLALGYSVVDRCVNFRKDLPTAEEARPSFYGAALARIHHEHFSTFGVDLSQDMLRIARLLVPEAELVHGSLWDVRTTRARALHAGGNRSAPSRNRLRGRTPERLQGRRAAARLVQLRGSPRIARSPKAGGGGEAEGT